MGNSLHSTSFPGYFTHRKCCFLSPFGKVFICCQSVCPGVHPLERVLLPSQLEVSIVGLSAIGQLTIFWSKGGGSSTPVVLI